MIISSSKSFLLLHVPKTGGRSVKDALEDHLAGQDDDLLLSDQFRLVRGADGRAIANPIPGSTHAPVAPHWPASIVQPGTNVTLDKHSTLKKIDAFFTADFLKTLTKIIVVRNPYSRIYSAWRFSIRKSAANEKLYSKMFQNGDPISIEDYIGSGKALKMMASRPQSLWAHGNQKPDMVLKTETLADDIKDALERLGYSDDLVKKTYDRLASGRKNVSAGPEDWMRMSDRAFDMIRDLYKADFDLFGYSFDPESYARPINVSG